MMPYRTVFEGFLDKEQGWLENKIEDCRYCVYCRYGLGEIQGALAALLRSFNYDAPRAAAFKPDAPAVACIVNILPR